MFPAKNGRLSWQEALKFINKCPVCGVEYVPEKARLFAQNEKANLVHISCKSCHGNFIAMVLVMQGGISTIGMVSDLNFEDAKRLHVLPPVNIDELIEGRKYINNNDLILKIV
ncbi:MAG: hypothetical protein NTW66_02315 [Candidatus Magasanikbacteria bacterium]|nr:hypothetical protein [Candidatus Magasanikbacteria bacterium]